MDKPWSGGRARGRAGVCVLKCVCVCAEFQIYPGSVSEVIAGGRGVQLGTTSNEAT